MLVSVHEQDSLNCSTLLQPIQLQVHCQSWKRERERKTDTLLLVPPLQSLIPAISAWTKQVLDHKNYTFLRLMTRASEQQSKSAFNKRAPHTHSLRHRNVHSHTCSLSSPKPYALSFNRAAFRSAGKEDFIACWFNWVWHLLHFGHYWIHFHTDVQQVLRHKLTLSTTHLSENNKMSPS